MKPTCSISWRSLHQNGCKTTFWLSGTCLVTIIFFSGCISPSSVVIGLEPQYPAPRKTYEDFQQPPPLVDSLQSTLRWESFPRPQDREAQSEGLLSRVSSVTYDLRIWKAEDRQLPDQYLLHPFDGHPRSPILDLHVPVYTPFIATHATSSYDRQGLPHPRHRLEEPLEPSTEYFWSIRVRFKLDGELRLTQWAALSHNWKRDGSSKLAFSVPSHHRFKTPGE